MSENVRGLHKMCILHPHSNTFLHPVVHAQAGSNTKTRTRPFLRLDQIEVLWGRWSFDVIGSELMDMPVCMGGHRTSDATDVIL